MTIDELRIKVMETKKDPEKRKKTARQLWSKATFAGCKTMTVLQLDFDARRQYKAYDSASMVLGQLGSEMMPMDEKFIEVVKGFFDIKEE